MLSLPKTMPNQVSGLILPGNQNTEKRQSHLAKTNAN